MQTEDYEYLYALEETFWWFEGMREITASLLDPICPPGRNRLILDAGCGTGGNLDWLQRYSGNEKVRGIDLSVDGLKFCSTRENKLVAQSSVTALPFVKNEIDWWHGWFSLPGPHSTVCSVASAGGVDPDHISRLSLRA